MKRFNSAFLFWGMLACLCNVCSCSGKVAQTEVSNSLVVEEYQIGEGVGHSYTRQEILAKMERQRETSLSGSEVTEGKLEYVNGRLKHLGYRFVQTESNSYDFYKGEDLIEERLHDIRGFSMDSKEVHFVFSASKWRVPYPECELVWVNDELLRIKRVGNIRHTELYFIVNGFIDKSLLDEILQKTTVSWDPCFKYNLPRLPPQVIYPFFVPMTAGGGPIINLWAYEKGWVLEVEGDAVVNGKSLRAENNLVWVAGFSLIKSKPFYFFVHPQDMDPTGEWPHNIKIRMSYDGKVLPVWYEWVGVGDLGRGYEGERKYDILKNEDMICFLAQREAQWYYVEAGLYK